MGSKEPVETQRGRVGLFLDVSDENILGQTSPMQEDRHNHIASHRSAEQLGTNFDIEMRHNGQNFMLKWSKS